MRPCSGQRFATQISIQKTPLTPRKTDAIEAVLRKCRTRSLTRNKNAHRPRGMGGGLCDLRNPDFLRGRWCCQTGLNCRPLHYQWSALPLSYGSMPPENRPKKAPTRRADPCHKAPTGASASQRRCHQKRYNQPWARGGLLQEAQLRADPVPHFLAQCRQRLDRPDHDLEFDHFAGRDASVRFSSIGLVSD